MWGTAGGAAEGVVGDMRVEGPAKMFAIHCCGDDDLIGAFWGRGGRDGLWRYSNGKLSVISHDFGHYIVKMIVCPNERFVVVGCDGGAVYLCEIDGIDMVLVKLLVEHFYQR